jgi:hypothetical protein
MRASEYIHSAWGLKTSHSWSRAHCHWLRRQEFSALVKIWKSCCCGLILNFVPQRSGGYFCEANAHYSLIYQTLKNTQHILPLVGVFLATLAITAFLAEVRTRWAFEGRRNKSRLCGSIWCSGRAWAVQEIYFPCFGWAEIIDVVLNLSRFWMVSWVIYKLFTQRMDHFLYLQIILGNGAITRSFSAPLKGPLIRTKIDKESFVP